MRSRLRKLELLTRDCQHAERPLFAGNCFDKARGVFAAYARKRPRAQLTIRQRTRVVAQWPKRSP